MESVRRGTRTLEITLPLAVFENVTRNEKPLRLILPYNSTWELPPHIRNVGLTYYCLKYKKSSPSVLTKIRNIVGYVFL